jgi:hypothetical protein
MRHAKYMIDTIHDRFSMMPKWIYSKRLKFIAIIILIAIAINFLTGIKTDVSKKIQSEENIEILRSTLHSLSECFTINIDSVCLPRLASVSMLLDESSSATVLSGRAYDTAQLYLDSKHLENADPELHTRLVMWGYYDKLISDERVYLPIDRQKINKFQNELKNNYHKKLGEIDEKITNR